MGNSIKCLTLVNKYTNDMIFIFQFPQNFIYSKIRGGWQGLKIDTLLKDTLKKSG